MTATRGNQTARPCHRCMIPMSEMPYTHEHPVRTIQSLRSVRKTSRQMKEEAAREAHRGRPKAARDLREDAKNIMTANSVALYTGFLESSLLVEYLNGECVMDIFAFEPLHNFHLGISKLLKTCICERMRNKNGKNRITILTACNDLLALYQKESYVKDMQFNYTSTEKGNRVNGIFTNDGLRGMLEAKNYKAIDMVFPFVAAFIDRCSGDEESHPLTKVCSRYTELMTWTLQIGSSQGWTEADVNKLQKLIDSFKTIARDVLGEYHPS